MNADVTAISKAWRTFSGFLSAFYQDLTNSLAKDGEVPTPRAVQERLLKIRQLSKSSGAAHFSISAVNTGKGSKPSTPRKPKVKVEKDDIKPPKTPPPKAKGNGAGKKRPSADADDDSATEGISLPDIDDIFESPSARVKRIKRATARNSSYKDLLGDTGSEADADGEEEEEPEDESEFGAEAREEEDEEEDEEEVEEEEEEEEGDETKVQGNGIKKENLETMTDVFMEGEVV